MRYIILLIIVLTFIGCYENEQTIVVHLPNSKEVFTVPPLIGQKTAVVYLTQRELVSEGELYCSKITNGTVLPSEYKNPLYMIFKDLSATDTIVDIPFKNVFKDDYFLVVEIYNTENLLKSITCTAVVIENSSNQELK